MTGIDHPTVDVGNDEVVSDRSENSTDSSDVSDDEYSDARCGCDDPEVGRTLAEGTPAERSYCDDCGGYIPPRKLDK